MADKDLKNLPKLTQADFEFVNDVSSFSEKKDEKLSTKPTTFAKDAFKRFCKNKSSVVGAIIIAILMFGSIFYPMMSPYDTTTVQDPACYLLEPKLFNAGTGWWDGCRTITTYYGFDGEKMGPIKTEYNKPRAILQDTMEILDVEYYDYSGENFTGGTARISQKNQTFSAGAEYFYFKNANTFETDNLTDLKVDIEIPDYDIATAGYTKTDYKVVLNCDGTEYTLKDYSRDTGVFTFDIQQILIDNSIALSEKTSISIVGKKSTTSLSYFLVKSVIFKSTSEDEEYLAQFDNVNIVDANYSVYTNEWVSNEDKYMYRAESRQVRYRYDMYEHRFGLKPGYMVGKTLMDDYVANGWCTFDWNLCRAHKDDPEFNFDTALTILDEDALPICKDDNGKYITGYTYSSYGGQDVSQIECNVQYYKILKFKSMPKYIFGSDSSGLDLLTQCLRCLKNSLLVSIICCAICITVGIIWGSISGYYGGAVDLFMERFSDILSGIPSTVVLTLMLLLLGRTTVTFGLAVCMTGWIGTAALTRTQFYRFKNREHVLASRTLGARDSRLIFKHILPNSLGTIVTSCVLDIPAFIFTEASLAFMHLGLDTGNSFGVILSNNQTYLSTFPVLVILPAFILCLLMISFNLFGNGLRDALNPTLKGGE